MTCKDRHIAYTMVMAVMDNLYRKRWLRRHRDGQARWDRTGAAARNPDWVQPT